MDRFIVLDFIGFLSDFLTLKSNMDRFIAMRSDISTFNSSL